MHRDKYRLLRLLQEPLALANTQTNNVVGGNVNAPLGLLQPVPWTFTMGAGNSQAGARQQTFGTGVAAGAAVAGGLTAQQQQAHAAQGIGNQLIGGATAQGAYVNNLWGSAGRP